jgi:hypothetical protein
MGDNEKLVEIKSINAWSVFKLALIAYVVIGLLFGLLAGIFTGLLGGLSTFSGVEQIPYANTILGATSGFFGGVFIGVLAGVLYGIAAGIGAAIFALLYDLFAAIAGGVKIRIKDN